MAYLFDTDALSETLRSRPLPDYLEWLSSIPREDQYTSAIVIGELFKGAFRSSAREKHLANIETLVLPEVTILPYDVAVARVYGEIRAMLEETGAILADADLQIAATSIHHDLALVTGNLRHFSRIEGLVIEPVLAEARRSE
ncbi:MAG: type II toxin-antitoxin system VapC family toxin [Gemmatimonadota bacterium]